MPMFDPRMTMRAAAMATFTLLLIAPGLAAAQSGPTIYQRVPFASSPNPVGSGGRAVAWGGAFIAVADDATAASWNPGGLVQLVRPETSVAMSYHSRLEALDFSGLGSSSESASLSSANLNYASIVYPFNIGNYNMVASLNYQRLYEFDRDLEYSASGTIAPGRTFVETRSIEQIGALTTVTPAFAIQVLPQFSVGVAVNFWGLDSYGDGWKQQWQVRRTNYNVAAPGGIEILSWSENREEYKLSGTNFVIGAHYKYRNWTFGAVYKSSFEADVDFTSEIESASFNFLNPALSSTPYTMSVEEDEKIVWPESYGVGVAYRYSDRLSLALDLYTTRWSGYKLKKDGRSLNLLAGNDATADVKDTWQVRGGGEYLWILPKVVVAARGGLFYDPEPLEDHINEFWGTAFGAGLVYDNWVFDAALQYRWGEGVKGEMIEGVSSEADVEDYFFIVSVIYHL